MSFNRVLVAVPCGRSKIWDREPHHSSVTAAEAYTGTPFRLNRQYAERFGDAWVVLSAKYGFIAPTFIIPEPYEVSFKYPATDPIPFDRLRQRRNTGDDCEATIGSTCNVHRGNGAHSVALLHHDAGCSRPIKALG
jgi:hypothetical protein